jgi:hypothetical protein
MAESKSWLQMVQIKYPHIQFQFNSKFELIVEQRFQIVLCFHHFHKDPF